MPATDDDTLLPFSLPSIGQKKITAAFDGGLISSDGGVLLLAGADKRLGLIDTLAAIIPDHRDPDLITHSMADILRARVFAIACGYPDADDLDDLRKDPAFKLVHLAGIGDSVGAAPANRVAFATVAPKTGSRRRSAIGVNRMAVRRHPLDVRGRISCRLSRRQRCNCRLSMNGN